MSQKTTPVAYDENAIKTLSSLDHIRLRPGMYIGRLGNGNHRDDGIYVLVKEVVDNAIDEFIMGHGSRVEIRLEGDLVTVRDFGRGIPLGKVVDCVSTINTGAKYNDDVFQFSVGLNGVGTKAVNALSASFTVRSYREGRYKEARFEQGALVHEEEGPSKERNGTLVQFVADTEVFGPFHYNLEFLNRRFAYYAYLNAGLSLDFNGEIFYSDQGLYDLLQHEVESEKLYDPIYFKGHRIEFALTHTQAYGDDYLSFVNGQYTSDGGTHLSAFKEGVLKGVNEFAKRSFQADDVREGLAGAIAIKIKDPVFESQTKNKLGNTDVKTWIVQEVKREVEDYLYKNPEVAQIILDKVSLNERIRKELQGIKKLVKEKAKKVAVKVPKLKDCKFHLNAKQPRGEESMIFITEGQSASGSIVMSRDVMTQAVFPLKGKPVNVYGAKRNLLYENEELYNIVQALGIEDNVDNLRYNKVILATDADVDGMHIRNLLLTIFLHFFEALVLRGHVYILETPLFRVRNPKQTLYCYSEQEKESALKKLGKGAEITRFKGLGEISPQEFGQFIGKDMRLLPVSVREKHEIPRLLTFYMGKNTQERKQYIMENLV
ncbi:DNA topoisomerase IV [bacterium (Candidatus Blackallbacteria) CG17_big_fil_post_rev_8_21_14_2_50_48_46]|uniref:DNA topoisomerase (ATP-hydrolyzing) n=1 Tax=bacterium (Candidatus Blackallbacteria) CG17_big_fil_post_rev_8_21_14_2_50_48_46 TaxID=2014261 RepID=A0A2M7G0X8_9BACT|nr:MAG: DNA topoisomerase IV [bacterium (Candidatus Blackallbacteria) CG18_big_fil_WC_8_21_14_2_50_49_26]PIW15273.1 MAG: DNA topoisomerase IV [bacterium (Candidatus Blackallbacteria) CG17_big_fil_post_rev_8_21_14_2_50_48_46]PIW45218.1 MAG: DNA topoisomerase IV [bacterium (Candidatus Blackallbacteria) CG13_big_fil_rev_8_21_14_2_50_49_14]